MLLTKLDRRPVTSGSANCFATERAVREQKIGAGRAIAISCVKTEGGQKFARKRSSMLIADPFGRVSRVLDLATTQCA